MTLLRMVALRDAVTALCAAIDAGEVQPREEEVLALALLVAREGGPLAHDLLVTLASRCAHGRAVLRTMAQ
jgi:hypothetical protein